MIREERWEVEKGERPEKPEKAEKRLEEKKRGKGVEHTPEEKCRAVLAVWTEKRRSSELCREMGVRWLQFHSWEKQAIKGMLLALQPSPERSVALNRHLTLLLEKRSRKIALGRLEKRLARLQANAAKAAEPNGGEKKV